MVNTFKAVKITFKGYPMEETMSHDFYNNVKEIEVVNDELILHIIGKGIFTFKMDDILEVKLDVK